LANRLRFPRQWAAARPLLLVTLCCAGCATQPQSSQPPASQPRSAPLPVNLSGYSTAFKQGYTDGCDSTRASLRRDERRYRNDGDYAMGWNDGKSVCQRR
jgi:hypothetical protein